MLQSVGNSAVAAIATAHNTKSLAITKKWTKNDDSVHASTIQ